MTKTHKHTKTGWKSPTYQSWSSMVARCRNPNVDSYKYYGAKGVKVCDRWLEFENFLFDMGERPVGMSIDRYPDQAGNYEPENCRWATPKQQMHNYSSNRLFTLNGETMCLAAWAERLGISPVSIACRLKAGMPIEEALTKQGKKNGRVISFNGESLTLTEWGKRLGMDRSGIAYRLKRYPVEIALTAPKADTPSKGLNHG